MANDISSEDVNSLIRVIFVDLLSGYLTELVPKIEIFSDNVFTAPAYSIQMYTKN